MRPEAVFQNMLILYKIPISKICGKSKVKTISEILNMQFCLSMFNSQSSKKLAYVLFLPIPISLMNPLKCMIGLQTFAAVLEKESGKLHWSLFFIVSIFFLLTFALQPSCPKKCYLLYIMLTLVFEWYVMASVL